MKTMETTEEVSSVGMEKREERRNWRQIVPCAREKPLTDLKKALKKAYANLWSRKKIAKKAHVSRRHDSKWEMSIYNSFTIF